MAKDPPESILLIDDGAIAAPPALVRAGLETLPAAITAAGASTSERFIDFFTANIRNRNTRMAYAVAVRQFFNWCEQRGLQLEAIRPTTVAAYIEQLGADMAKPSVKQHLAAIRQLFDYQKCDHLWIALHSTPKSRCWPPCASGWPQFTVSPDIAGHSRWPLFFPSVADGAVTSGA